MTPDTFHHCLILTGPTGSGKSALALELAPRLNAEIVAMDSMTLYRGMDIGTAKPTPEERARVPHHLIDVLDPHESASVAWWLAEAAAVVKTIESRGKRVLFVGGTALYLKALLHGLFDGPPADAALRLVLEDEARQLGTQALHNRLATVDPVSAARLHPNDLRRIVRALEVQTLTGQPISAWQTQWATRGADLQSARGEEEASCELAPRVDRCICLDVAREELYANINARVLDMIDRGLVEEVRALRELEPPPGREASQALGSKELFAYLDGRVSLEEVVREIQTRSRNFAKRQLTWFRHLDGCRLLSGPLTREAWVSRMDQGV